MLGTESLSGEHISDPIMDTRIALLNPQICYCFPQRTGHSNWRWPWRRNKKGSAETWLISSWLKKSMRPYRSTLNVLSSARDSVPASLCYQQSSVLPFLCASTDRAKWQGYAPSQATVTCAVAAHTAGNAREELLQRGEPGILCMLKRCDNNRVPFILP